jgi:hypothetical protein
VALSSTASTGFPRASQVRVTLRNILLAAES